MSLLAVSTRRDKSSMAKAVRSRPKKVVLPFEKVARCNEKLCAD